MFNSKQQKTLSLIVFGIYMFLLAWLIMFKLTIDLSNLNHSRNINFIPFGESMIVNGKLELKEIIYNVLVFVPFGVYLNIFKNDWSFIKKLVSCLFLSLIFEVLQFIFALGASDITDIINNTLGGFFGIVLCILFRKVFKQRFITIINSIGLIVEVVAIIMLGILLIVNM